MELILLIISIAALAINIVSVQNLDKKNIFVYFFPRDLKTENVFLTKSNVAKIGKLYKCHDSQ